MVMPNLSASFQRRFDVANGSVTDYGAEVNHVLAARALVQTGFNRLRLLSRIGKMDAENVPINDFRYELPPMELTAALVNLYHVKGSAPPDRMPFKLKALGRIDAQHVFQNAGKPGLTADKYAIVP